VVGAPFSSPGDLGLQEMLDPVHLRIHIIEIMEHDRLKGHGLFRRAPDVQAMVAEDDMPDQGSEIFRKIRNLADLILYSLQSEKMWPQESASSE